MPYTPATTYGVHMNTYYTLAWMHLSPPAGPGTGRVIETDDIRHQYAGRSAVGDWAGANQATAGEFDPTA